MTALANGSQFHKFPRNSDFYLTTRNPTVQLQLFSVYIDCLWGLGELELPLDLTR